MARLGSWGFELAITSGDVEIGGIGSSGNATMTINSTSTYVRSGSYSLKIANTGTAGIVQSNNQYAAANGNGPYFARIYIYIASFPSTDYFMPMALMTADSLTIRCMFKITNAGVCQLLDGTGAQIGSDGPTLSTGQWYNLEMMAGNGAATIELAARVNLVEFARGSTANNAGTMSRLYIGNFSGGVATTGYEYYFDDVAINDATGLWENSWCGDGHIVHLKPAGAGNNTGWTPSAGSNYDCVNEVTPNSDTDYISATTAVTDDYTVDTPPGDLINTSWVKFIGVSWFARWTGSAATIIPRLTLGSSGLVTEGSSSSLANTTYRTNRVNDTNYVLTPDLIVYSRASIFGQEKLNSTDLQGMQIGIRQSNAPVSASRVSALWAVIEYTDGVHGDTSRFKNKIRLRPFSPGIAK